MSPCRCLDFRRCDPATPPASDLIAAVLAEYDVVAGRHLTGGPSATADDFSPPGGAFLVGFARAARQRAAAASRRSATASRRSSASTWLRRSAARAWRWSLLQALEDEARRLGHRTIRLDTTTPTWPMYLPAGYRDVTDYNGNPHATVWGEKDL